MMNMVSPQYLSSQKLAEGQKMDRVKKSPTLWKASDFQADLLIQSLKSYREQSKIPAGHVQAQYSFPKHVGASDALSAVRAVFERHSIFRGQFKFNGSVAFFRLIPFDNTWFKQSLYQADSPDEFDRICSESYNEPFSIDGDQPLWRIRCIEYDNKLILAITFHHAIVEYETVRQIARELSKMLSVQSPSDLTSPEIGYETYLGWLTEQNTSVSPGKCDELAELSGFSTAIASADLSDDDEDLRAESFSVDLPEGFSDALVHFCKENRLSYTYVFLAAWSVLLSRVTFQNNIGFGVNLTTRSGKLAGSEKCMGPMVATRPFRVRVESAKSAVAYINYVRQIWRQSSRLKYIEQNRNQVPIAPSYSTIFNHHVDKINHLEYGHEENFVDLYDVKNIKATLPTFSVTEKPILDLAVIAPPRFRNFARQAAAALPVILNNLVLNNAPPDSISLCDGNKADLVQVVEGPTRNFTHRDLQSMIKWAFAENALSVAIERGALKIDYATLDDITDHIVSRIGVLTKKMSNDGPIVLIVPKSVRLSCLVAAVIKGGWAFICLNSDTPTFSIRETLNRVSPNLIVAQGENSFLQDFETQGFVCWDVGKSFDDFMELLDDSPSETQSCSNVAYLVQTSGSTGDPKIIQIGQNAATNTVSALIDFYRLSPGQRRFQNANPGPDIYISELLTAMCSGATLVLPKGGRPIAPSDILDQYWQLDITIASLVSSHWSELVLYLEQHSSRNFPPNFKTLIIGAETVRSDMLEKWWRTGLHRIRLLNVYGPAEATIVTTCCCLNDLVDEGDCPTPIGLPIANMRISICDQLGYVLPLGMTGEICISGPGLMLGYLAEASSTDTDAIKPSLTVATNRYRSGDFGYLGENGVLYFAGRRDDQVKIRGYRVELSDIERRLGSQLGKGSITSAVIGVDRTAKVIAFIYAEEPIDLSLLHNQLLRNNRPELVPAKIIQTEKPFPRLANGKIDKQKLVSNIDHLVSPVVDVENLAKSDLSTEAKFLEVWRSVLAYPQADLKTDFFDAGGSSLDAIEMTILISDVLNKNLHLDLLFKLRTPEALLKSIEHVENRIKAETSPILYIAQQMPKDVFVEHQSTLMKTWKRAKSDSDDLLVAENPLAENHNLFWCFQGYQELQSLGNVLDDKCIYGARSAHLIIPPTRQNIFQISEMYADLIVGKKSPGPVVLGGNCQGGQLMAGIALHLLSQGINIHQLLLLDVNLLDEILWKPIGCPTTIIFGELSTFNPMNSGQDTYQLYKRHFTDRLKVSHVPGGHGEYFREPSLSILGNHLRPYLR